MGLRFPHIGRERIVVAHDAAALPDPVVSATSALALPGRGERLQVGYVGHLYPGKGMEIVAELAARMPEADFHVVGGKPKDLELWQQRTAACPNLSFHGYVAPALTDSYRQAFDVLLAPYQREVTLTGGVCDVARWMSPLKIFESMAAGVPVVASDLPVLREVLRHGENALLAGADDPSDWEKALQRLIDPGLREQLGRRALADVVQYYTWEQRAARVLEGLEGVG
jgi:glycosyltransferase involved in cell wall biosynthesis